MLHKSGTAEGNYSATTNVGLQIFKHQFERQLSRIWLTVMGTLLESATVGWPTSEIMDFDFAEPDIRSQRQPLRSRSLMLGKLVTSFIMCSAAVSYEFL